MWQERADRLLELIEELRSESDSPSERRALQVIEAHTRLLLLGEHVDKRELTF